MRDALAKGSLVLALVALAGSARADETTTTTEAPKEPPKAEEEKPKEEPKVRGPAEDLIIEASFGYGVGALSAIADYVPRVPHGPVFHLAAGWAWSIRSNQSVGVQFFGDGMFDSERIAGEGGTSIGGRYGASAFVIGERAHLRLGFGYAHTRLAEKGSFDGLSVAFAAGFHRSFGAESWKRPMFTTDFIPSWDFLGAGSETLHRWSFSLLIGFALY